MELTVASREPAGPAKAPERGLTPLQAAAKRLFDVVLAGAALALLMPLFALLAVMIRLESRGPVFYRARRVGYRGRPLSMLKFRKMHASAAGPGLTVAGDERFTRVGSLLARLKLDELPQLWHVLRGDMSIVGPRPESEEFVARHPEEYAEIVHVRPGIIGLSQIAFAEESLILDQDDLIGHYVTALLPAKIGLDCLYVRNWTLWLDIRTTLWGIVVVILRRPVSVHRADASMSLRRR